jgi:protease I
MTALDDATVAILCADGVEQVEVVAPRDALAGAGATVDLLSPDSEDVRGYHYIKSKDMLPVRGSIAEADPERYTAAVLPGGLGGPDTLRTDETALRFVRGIAASGKPIAVICHGPWLLLDADLLRGRSLTCAAALRTDVRNGGATYVDEETHVDATGKPVLISGRNFEAAGAFADAVLGVLSRETR